MTVEWAEAGKATTILIIVATLIALVVRRARRLLRDIAEAGRHTPLAQKNYDHDNNALGFAPQWPSNRIIRSDV